MFLIKHKLVLDKIFSGKGFFFKLFVKFKIQFQIANSYNEYFMRKKKSFDGPDKHVVRCLFIIV